jgi:hypothetical protein
MEKQIFYKVLSTQKEKLFSAWISNKGFRKEYRFGMNYAKKALVKKNLGLAVFRTQQQAKNFGYFIIGGDYEIFECYGFGPLKVKKNCCSGGTLERFSKFFLGIAKHKPKNTQDIKWNCGSWPTGTHLFKAIKLIKKV